MSTAPKRPHGEALAIAREFAALFEDTAEIWQIAGSLRRRCHEVGDCEHVCIAKPIVAIPEGELMPRTFSAVWKRCDELLAAGKIGRAVYPDGKHRWGDILRGCDFMGMRHEIWTADRDNFGCILTIRTGPADFSQALVTHIKQTGRYRQKDGYLRYASGPAAGSIRSCPTEEQYFTAAGWAYRAPEKRV